jgi:uncharacterized membrane protein YvbJ
MNTCTNCRTDNPPNVRFCNGCGHRLTSTTASVKPVTSSGVVRGLKIVVWIIPILGAGAGGLVLVAGMTTAGSAPQEAVVCALACAIAIIPYVFARAVSEIISP